MGDCLSEVRRLDERIAWYDRQQAQLARESKGAKCLLRLCGIGETTATALTASIGNGHDFQCGRRSLHMKVLRAKVFAVTVHDPKETGWP